MLSMCGAIDAPKGEGLPGRSPPPSLTYSMEQILLEKLTVNFAASQEIPRIYGTRKFLTLPTSARHLSLRLRDTSSSNTPPPKIRMGE
jgi:hypothetical protein